jgi:hypothetical protein
MSRIIIFGMIVLILFSIDLYVYQAVKTAFQNFSTNTLKIIGIVYWAISLIVFCVIGFFFLTNPQTINLVMRNFIITSIVTVYFSKIIILLFLLLDDLIRIGQWTYQNIAEWFIKPSTQTISTLADNSTTSSPTIPRSEFLAKTGLILSTVPVFSISFGILSGAHDYRVRKVKLHLPNLPKSFDGVTFAQLSDIHSGSFFNKKAVKGGVEMLMAEKPDMIMFTGDLVNYVADEVKEYVPIFEKLKAPLGVYSVLGNHDYGDYVQWNTPEERIQNIENLKQAHQLMGWRLLINENVIIEQGSEKIAILGIENWGNGRFPKYGKMQLAHQGTQEASIKILLSHDPSHWDAQVRTQYSDIDLMLSGHTHGMQFGVEIPGIKWSPVQYVYKQWADLYQENNQYLYVNRGFGYIGFPGRIGILPEITIFELNKNV